jgi:uncharacterized protein YbaR (Trm112 family)
MSDSPAAERLRALLACPVCHGPLLWSTERVTCSGCAASYQIEDGIPVMLPPPSGDAQALAHKRRQAEFFSQHEDAEFETTRPHGTPRFYRFLMEEKFRRSVAGLGDAAGATVLTVCGGSGMDAQFLAEAGFTVLASDLSVGAARRARERSRRFGADIAAVVADVECLPFAGASVDFTYVHDGLHHLGKPLTGLNEMVRVAGRGVSVTEPSQAVATSVAVKVHLSIEYEDAGNRVERLKIEEVVRAMEDGGFKVTAAERYAMRYRHEPGPLIRLYSLPGTYQITTFAWRSLNGLIGRFGNKLTVQAVR